MVEVQERGQGCSTLRADATKNSEAASMHKRAHMCLRQHAATYIHVCLHQHVLTLTHVPPPACAYTHTCASTNMD